MKQLKIITLAVVAVAAFMATIGAGSASATLTSLCKAKETVNGIPTCAKANEYPAGTRIHAEREAGTTLRIATPVGVVECTFSTLDAITEQQTAIPLGAIVNALVFGNCHQGPEEVEVVTLKNNGTLTLTGTEITIRWKVSGAHCWYDAGHTGVLTGGPMATIDWAGTLTKTGGNLLCPEGNANWNGAYTVTSPEPLWVSM